MPRRPTAREQEARAASAPRPPSGAAACPPGEVAAMLVRRGFDPTPSPLDLPFPADLDGDRADRLAERLCHYAFRLFLRGAIQRASGFTPREATRFLTPTQSRPLAEFLLEMGLAERLPRRRYRLVHPARSFGGTLEWYVARELHRRYGFDVALGVKCRAPGVGGDLDVVAAAEGKLVYLELKSSPPRHLSAEEVAAFLDRVQALHPDVALFVVDTALRLSDKVVPLFAEALARRKGAPVAPRRVERELWALAPHVLLVNAKSDLVANVGRAISEALSSRAPSL